MKTKTYIILLVLILLSGFLIRVYCAHAIHPNKDEGNYLYDSMLQSEGKIPYKDFMTKSAFFLFLVNQFTAFFPNSLFGGRLISVFATTITIFFVYLIGKELYSKKTGLIASVIYAFAPFIVFWNIEVLTEPTQQLFLTISMYFLVLAYKRDKNKHFFLNGLFLGLAFIIRRSALIFLILEPLLLIYLYKKDSIKKIVCFGAGCLVPIMSAFTYYISIAGFLNVFKMVGPDYSIQKTFDIFRLFASRVWTVHFLFIEASYLLIAILLIIFIPLKNLFKKTLRYTWFVSLAYFAVFSASFVISYIGVRKYSVSETIIPLYYGPMLYINLVMIILSAILFFLALKNIDLLNRKKDIIPYFWFFTGFLFYFFYIKWSTQYFSELSAAGSLMFSLFLVRIKKRISRQLFVLFIVFFILGAVFSISFYVEKKGIARQYPGIDNELKEYLIGVTKPNEEIFTANTLLAYETGRKIVLDISHPIMYTYPRSLKDIDEIGIPSVKTIINYLDKKPVKYVVLDYKTEDEFLKMSPELKQYIDDNYVLEKETKTTKLLVRK